MVFWSQQILLVDILQRLASDFLSNYIFVAVGRVGSSTGLIAQKVDYVLDMDKRSHLVEALHTQMANGSRGKVCWLFVLNMCSSAW